MLARMAKRKSGLNGDGMRNIADVRIAIDHVMGLGCNLGAHRNGLTSLGARRIEVAHLSFLGRSCAILGGASPPRRSGPKSGRCDLVFKGCSLLVFLASVAPCGLAYAGTWTQLAPAGGPPPARAAHSAVLDNATNQMIVFGGYGPPD